MCKAWRQRQRECKALSLLFRCLDPVMNECIIMCTYSSENTAIRSIVAHRRQSNGRDENRQSLKNGWSCSLICSFSEYVLNPFFVCSRHRGKKAELDLDAILEKFAVQWQIQNYSYKPRNAMDLCRWHGATVDEVVQSTSRREGTRKTSWKRAGRGITDQRKVKKCGSGKKKATNVKMSERGLHQQGSVYSPNGQSSGAPGR